MKSTPTTGNSAPSLSVRRKSPARGDVRSPSRKTSAPSGMSVPASRPRVQAQRRSATLAPSPTAGQSARATLRQEFRAWHASLPTALERETLRMPGAIAESVVQEAERFLAAELPANFATRLAAKAEYLYPRHPHFRKMLNRPGNAGRNHLYTYMRHWTAGRLKRERNPLHKKLPWSFGHGPTVARPDMKPRSRQPCT